MDVHEAVRQVNSPNKSSSFHPISTGLRNDPVSVTAGDKSTYSQSVSAELSQSSVRVGKSPTVVRVILPTCDRIFRSHPVSHLSASSIAYAPSTFVYRILVREVIS